LKIQGVFEKVVRRGGKQGLSENIRLLGHFDRLSWVQGNKRLGREN
jgi:hypothetical protein